MSVRICAVGSCLLSLLLCGGCGGPTADVVAPRPAPARPVPARQAQAIELPARVTITPADNPGAETRVTISESSDTLVGTNLRFVDLVSLAYRTPEQSDGVIPLMSAVRVESSEPLPTGRYDVFARAPGASAGQLRAALRLTLERKYGIRVRREQRSVPVLALVAPQGRIIPPRTVGDAPVPPDTGYLTFSGTDLSLLAEQLEERLEQPVVDETHLRAEYRLRVVHPGFNVLRPASVEGTRAAVREQLGLDLKPAERVIEVFIVESVPSAD